MVFNLRPTQFHAPPVLGRTFSSPRSLFQDSFIKQLPFPYPFPPLCLEKRGRGAPGVVFRLPGGSTNGKKKTELGSPGVVPRLPTRHPVSLPKPWRSWSNGSLWACFSPAAPGCWPGSTGPEPQRGGVRRSGLGFALLPILWCFFCHNVFFWFGLHFFLEGGVGVGEKVSFARLAFKVTLPSLQKNNAKRSKWNSENTFPGHPCSTATS